MIKTEKVYYEDSFLHTCDARIVGITENKVILDRTVAFPEGGGQIGDVGNLYLDGKQIPFHDTQKGIGRVLSLQDFPSIQVEAPVYHITDGEQLTDIFQGAEVKVKINVEHRIRTTVLHSALHLVLMAARERRPDLTNIIRGCKITTESARIDFFAKEKFTPEDIDAIVRRVRELVSLEIPIEVYPHEEEREAWYWKCLDFICPCGGTHLTNTGQAGTISVKRKNVGKATERLIVTAENVGLTESDFHD